MLTALLHFFIGFTAALALAFIYWLTPLVLPVLGATSHHEYKTTRANLAAAEQNACNAAPDDAIDPEA
jgi:hypothetical protein